MDQDQPDRDRGPARHRLGRGQDRQALSADRQGAQGRRARHHVAAREGGRDRRPPRRRASRAGHGQDALWLGQEDPDQQPLAPQVLRPVRQHPRLPDLDPVAHEQAGHRPIWTRPTRPPARPGTTTARASATWCRWRRCSCATSIRPMSAPRPQGLPEGTYYPLVHCGTSFGNYKEMRSFLLHSAELRERGEEDPRQARPPGRRQAADPRGDRPLLRMAARDARPHQGASDGRCLRHPRDRPSGLPCLQDGARGRDL